FMKSTESSSQTVIFITSRVFRPLTNTLNSYVLVQDLVREIKPENLASGPYLGFFVGHKHGCFFLFGGARVGPGSLFQRKKKIESKAIIKKVPFFNPI